MPVKSDRWIRQMSIERGMIEPFAEASRTGGMISFGLSSYGYDVRLADEFSIVEEADGLILDPKGYEAQVLKNVSGPLTLPPRSFALTRSFEYFRIPRNIIALCFGKSTYARCGIVVNVTPLEPEWEGYITMSISNTSAFPVKLYPGEGIAQVVFVESDELCEVSYGDKKGKYQGQDRITPPRV
ncbi:MAG: dCTP deaminase [Candidatus Glassbacteria bacterium]